MDGALLRLEPDGSLAPYADLTGLADPPWSDLIVDGRGNAYVGNLGFDFLAGAPPAPGFLALVTPDGDARRVADDLAFPNGLAVTPDNATLIVAESYAARLTAFTIGADGSWRTDASGPTCRGPTRMASASTPRAPSGSPRCPAGAACASGKAARCSRRSSSIAAASPARSAGRMGGRCSWPRRTGLASPGWATTPGPARS